MIRKNECLTPSQIDDAARILAVLLDWGQERQIDALAITCRLLWDGRLTELREELEAQRP